MYFPTSDVKGAFCCLIIAYGACVCVCVFQTVKAFLPQMKAQNHGHIVTIASVLGLFSTACVEVQIATFLFPRCDAAKTETGPFLSGLLCQ